MRRLCATLVIVGLLVACTNGMYDKAMEQGKLALANGEFQKALGSFELAKDEKPRNENANQYYKDVNAFLEVKRDVDEGNWQDAEEKARELLNSEELVTGLRMELKGIVEEVEVERALLDAIANRLAEIKITVDGGDAKAAQTSIAELKQDEEKKAIIDDFSAELAILEEDVVVQLKIQIDAAAEQEGMQAEKKKQQVTVEKKRQTPSGKRDRYFQKLYQIEASLSDLEYLTKDGVTSELIEAESERYKRWDDALNEIYGVLKTQISESEMNALREKQRVWIAYRNRTANAEGAKFAGGSAEPLACPNHLKDDPLALLDECLSNPFLRLTNTPIDHSR